MGTKSAEALGKTGGLVPKDRSSEVRAPASNLGGRSNVPRLQRSAGNAATTEWLQAQGSQTSAACSAFLLTSPEKSSSSKGIAVHSAIRDWFELTYGSSERFQIEGASAAPLRDKPYQLGGEPGRPDLAYLSKLLKTIEVAEIKPANQEEYGLGLIQLRHYIDKANSDERLKAEYGVTLFTEMVPWKFPLPTILLVQGRPYRLAWCNPGIILYKQVTENEKDGNEREESSKAITSRGARGSTRGSRVGDSTAVARAVRIEPGSTPDSRVLVFATSVSADDAALELWGRRDYGRFLSGRPGTEMSPGTFIQFDVGKLGVEQFISIQPRLREQWVLAGWGHKRVVELPEWIPPELATAVRNGQIAEGLDKVSWKYEWPHGFTTPLLVNRTRYYVEFQALYPEELGFYELFAENVGQSEAFARQLHGVCTDFNKDLISLLKPEFSSIDYAQGRLRGINQSIHRALLMGFAMSFGAAGGIGRVPPTSLSTARTRLPHVKSSQTLPPQVNEGTFKAILEIINRSFAKGRRSPVAVP